MSAGRWMHGDDYCPRRPYFGRRAGRLYECKRDPIQMGGFWAWRLVGAPKDR